MAKKKGKKKGGKSKKSATSHVQLNEEDLNLLMLYYQ
jgi:hypothetical protein